MINPQKILPPYIVLVLYIVAVVCQFIFKPMRIVPTHFVGLGWVIAIGGFVFMSWTRMLFVKNNTSVRHSQTPTHFVLEGPYRISRNPMYIGALIMFFGIAVVVGTWPFWVVPVSIFIILDRIYIPWEEKTMQKFFPAEYEKYKSLTRRWL